MIYSFYNFIYESIKDALKGPSEEEVWNEIKDLKADDLLDKSIKIGYLKGVEKAINNGANIFSGDIITVCKYGYTDILNYFIDELNVKVSLGLYETISVAVANNQLEIVKILLDNGADIHIRKDSLLLISINNDLIEMTKFLIDNGIDTTFVKNYLLENLVRNGKKELIELLIEDDYNIPNIDLLLHIAKDNDQLDIYFLLKQHIKK